MLHEEYNQQSPDGMLYAPGSMVPVVGSRVTANGRLTDSGMPDDDWVHAEAGQWGIIENYDGCTAVPTINWSAGTGSGACDQVWSDLTVDPEATLVDPATHSPNTGKPYPT